jgi:hypothetical protein
MEQKNEGYYMKKIILVGIMFMMFMGVVSASSINGDFEGNPIVKLLNDGNLVSPDDVPAIIYKGRTMVPISLLKKMGVDVGWNQKTYSVNISFPANQSDSITDLNGIKLMLTQADNFTWSENTAEYMQSFLNTLSNYFSGVNENYAGRLSSDDLDTIFSDLKNTVDKNDDILNSFVKNFPNVDNEKILDQINHLNIAFNNLEKAKNNLLSWEALRYSDKNKSQSNFDSFLSNTNKVTSDLGTVISDSHKEYLRLVNLILSL